MPTPLGPEPDSGPSIHEQVRAKTREAHTRRMAVVGLTFSQAGYRRAMAATVPGMDPWGESMTDGGGGPTRVCTHYLGLPFTINTKDGPWVPEVELVLVPGSSPEAKAFRDGQRDRADQFGGHRQNPLPIRVTAKGPMDRPTIEVLAEGLSTVQVCNLVQAWAALRPQGNPLAQALLAAVREHGRFE